ncbi:MAG: hypothetical protein KAJ95_07010 [Gammaproteobacteria bacterium]|nr:hypothetical protein [Gammaproteobacteria bacterium]
MIEKSQVSVPLYEPRDQRTVDKYLSQYSAPEARLQSSQLSHLAERDWDYVVTIPACGEDEFLPGALDSINECQVARSNKKVLCIVVLNGNAAREAEFKLSNRKMRDWFSKHCTPVAASLNPDNTCPQSLVSWKNIDILIVDRSQKPWLIPSDQGVGLVRKIGADIALYLIAHGWISCPWIHTTDADARVPDDYFLRASEPHISIDGNSLLPSCFIYPYQHIPDPEMEQHDHQRYWSALTDYELWLRYYVEGLEWAGSSYAYPSIGSLLAFDALAYARTRGFPKRMAGEDFYFQNKLAKVGAMITLKGKPIKLLTRASTRVPFGTGQGTISIDKMNLSGDAYTVYHPGVFYFLKTFNKAVLAWFEGENLNDKQGQKQFIISLDKVLQLKIKDSSSRRKWLEKLLDELNIFDNLQAATKRSKSLQGACNQFNVWFDGFRTLKLIHRLRDDIYGSLPLLDALQGSAFLQIPELKADSAKLKTIWLESLRANSH